jgi:hypothetical protein
MAVEQPEFIVAALRDVIRQIGVLKIGVLKRDALRK